MLSNIELDQFEAAAKKHKLREAAHKKKAEKRKRENYGDLDFKSEDENPYDSEEKEYEKDHEESVGEASYDSELEAEFFGKKDKERNLAENNRHEPQPAQPDQIDSKPQTGFSQDDFKDQIEDVNRTLRQFKVMKAADGVDFVQYDQYGLPIKDGDKDGLRAVLATDDGDDKGFEYVAPNQEQMEKVLQMQQELQFQGGRKDVDKRLDQMNEEERAVFDCMEDEMNVFAGAYEELDDDFLLALNDGKPALEGMQPLKAPPTLTNDQDHDNAGVEVLKVEGEQEEHPMMIPNYKEKMADVIAMLDKQKDIRKDIINIKSGKDANVLEREAKTVVN